MIDDEKMIACDDGLHLIQLDENISHYGWVFRKVEGGWPYSVRKATPHEIAHAKARQHLRAGAAQIAAQYQSAEQPRGEPVGEVVAFGEGLHEIAWAAGRMPKLGAKLYTHVDPAEVERLRAELKRLLHTSVKEEVFDIACKERDTLRTQLAEAHALLREAYDELTSWESKVAKRVIAALSASAEPSAITEKKS